jgi:hypothetical protein
MKYDFEYEKNGINKQETDLTSSEADARKKELEKEKAKNIKISVR